MIKVTILLLVALTGCTQMSKTRPLVHDSRTRSDFAALSDEGQIRVLVSEAVVTNFVGSDAAIIVVLHAEEQRVLACRLPRHEIRRTSSVREGRERLFKESGVLLLPFAVEVEGQSAVAQVDSKSSHSFQRYKFELFKNTNWQLRNMQIVMSIIE